MYNVCNLIIIHFRVQKKMYFVVSDIDLKTFGSTDLIVYKLGCIFFKGWAGIWVDEVWITELSRNDTF